MPRIGPTKAAINVVMATPETCRQAARGDSIIERYASRVAGVRAVRTRMRAYRPTTNPPIRSTASIVSRIGSPNMMVVTSTNTNPFEPIESAARFIMWEAIAPMKPTTRSAQPRMRARLPRDGLSERVRTPSGLMVTFESPKSELVAAMIRLTNPQTSTMGRGSSIFSGPRGMFWKRSIPKGSTRTRYTINPSTNPTAA